jgi:hypothetical protein
MKTVSSIYQSDASTLEMTNVFSNGLLRRRREGHVCAHPLFSKQNQDARLQDRTVSATPGSTPSPCSLDPRLGRSPTLLAQTQHLGYVREYTRASLEIGTLWGGKEGERIPMEERERAETTGFCRTAASRRGSAPMTTETRPSRHCLPSVAPFLLGPGRG